MIDIDKCKAAFAGSTLCQKAFYKPGTNLRPEMLCAVSALASYAGLEPRLIAKFTHAWAEFVALVAPVLRVEYGIPHGLTQTIPTIFDNEPNEWRAVDAVLASFAKHNMGVLHSQAIAEDYDRFPGQYKGNKWITLSIETTHFDWAKEGLASPLIYNGLSYGGALKANVMPDLSPPKSKYLPEPKPIKSSPMVEALNAFAVKV